MSRTRLLCIETEIARRLYEEVRARVVENKAVRLELRIEEWQRRWPSASTDQIVRGHLIAYEMLVQDVAEAVSAITDGNHASFPDADGKKGDEGRDPKYRKK